MKKKRPEREERRRALVEINLIADAKSRPARVARRGCALLPVLAVLAASAAAYVGLR